MTTIGTSYLAMYRTLAKIASKFPRDSLRNNNQQFGDAIEASARRAFGGVISTSSTTTTATSVGPSSAMPIANTTATTIMSKEEELEATEMVSALTRILNNDAYNKYPLSTKITKPASRPDHYDTVIAALGAARRGEKPKPFWRLRRFFEWK